MTDERERERDEILFGYRQWSFFFGACLFAFALLQLRSTAFILCVYWDRSLLIHVRARGVLLCLCLLPMDPALIIC
jgi:hypothetical protein